MISNPPIIVISPAGQTLRRQAAELVAYRDLLALFTLRDLSIRYKQTLLGFAWAFVQPVVTLLTFSVFLGKFARVSGGNLPYPLMAALGVIPWSLFTNAVTRAAASVVGNASLITKVYFPRIILPISGACASVVDFAISAMVLVPLLIVYKVRPAPLMWLIVPLAVLTLFVFSIGAGLFFAALNVRYRDVQHAIPFLLQVWMFATPVVYPLDVVPVKWRFLVYINPVSGVIHALRQGLTGGNTPWFAIATAVSGALVTVVAGAAVFRATEQSFADVV